MTRLACCTLAILLSTGTAACLGQDDGRRAVNVERFGIAVRAPQAWSLIEWGQDDKAFVLRLPQEAGSTVGYVSCELGVAPESLLAFQEQVAASDGAEPDPASSPASKLIKNAIETLKEDDFGPELAEKLKERLVNEWEHREESGGRWYESRTRVISEGTLYTFTLASDEAHYDAYRLDFEEMLASAQFTPPQTGLERLASGYWMQREFRFALKLPADWKPAFGPNDKAIFFASGAAHDLFTDSLLVLASPSRPLDLDELRMTLPDTLRQADPQAKVACQVLAAGPHGSLEILIQTRRGDLPITILERRFQGELRNYEVRFTCESPEFQRIEAGLHKSLESFVEGTSQPPKKPVL